MRRVSCLLVAMLFGVGPTAIAEPSPGEDWPRFGGPRGDGRSNETGILTDWAKHPPRLLWERPVGEGYSMPSVAAGRVFLFDRHADRARLTCIDAASGDELWRREYATEYEDMFGYSNGPRASPVIDGGRVWTYGVEGRLRAHRVADGKLLWEVDTAERFHVVTNFFGVGSSPVVEGDRVIVQVGGSPPDSPDIHSGKVVGAGSGIVAFDSKDGALRYAISDELASYSTPVFATIGDRRWGFVFARGGLVGFEPLSGVVDFQFPWRSPKLFSVNAASPLVVGDRVLVSEAYGIGSALLRVRPAGYEVLWKNAPRGEQALRSHWATPVLVGGQLYGCSGQKSADAALVAVDVEDGRLRWSRPGLGRSSLLHVDGHLLVLGEYGRLLLVAADPERYRELGEIDLRSTRAEAAVRARYPALGHPAWNAPILSRGTLYVRGSERLVALELIRPAHAER